MKELLENYSSINDLIVPKTFTYLDLNNKCLVYIIETDNNTYNYLKEDNKLKEFLTVSIIENTLYGHNGIADEDLYDLTYKNEEYTIQCTEYRQNVSSQYGIDYTFELNEKLTCLIEENSKYYLKIGFEFEISKNNFAELIKDMFWDSSYENFTSRRSLINIENVTC